MQYSGNKYHAKSTAYEGSVYDSKLEAAYAQELDLRVRAKDIKSWERQIKLELKVNKTKICDYRIDFIIHHNDDSREFVEVKGMELPLWKLKWKILEATFDDFKQHPDDRLSVIKQSSMMKFRTY